MEQKLGSSYHREQTSKREVLLEKELERQKKARKRAEEILEEKSKEHHLTTQQLKETNSKLEGLLIEKTSELEGVFLNILDAYVVVDMYGNIIKMNNAAKDLLGTGENQNVNVMNLVHQDYLEETQRSFEKLRALGALPNLTAKIVTSKNEEKLISINSSIIYDRHRNPIAAQGIVRDITRESQIKELLATQRRQLDVIVNRSPIAIALTKGKDLVKANVAFEELTGYSFHELKQLKSYRILSHKEDMPILLHKMRELKSGEADSFTLIKRFLRRDGSLIWARTTVSAVRNRKGEIEFEIVLAEDISEEIRTQSKIEEQQKQLQIIVDNSPLGVVLLIDNTIIKANTAFQNLIGYTERDLMGKSIIPLMYSRNDKEVEGYSANIYSTIEYVREDGTSVITRTTTSDVKSNTGIVLYQVLIIEDIREEIAAKKQEKLLIQELESSNRSLQEYAHIVSHDLKSPLRSVSALATWLNEDYKDVLDENGVYNLNMMQEKIESMDKLIGGILNYSSINKDDLKSVDVDLNKIIKKISDVIFIPDHVKIVTARELPFIKGDETRFHQLFQNIISNSVVHIEKDEGLVEIDYKDFGSHWQFSISDNGVGIPKEYHEKIFKIFESVGNKERSTGIGLSIVKKIIEIYQGEIWLESEINVGTTFFFTIKKTVVHENSVR